MKTEHSVIVSDFIEDIWKVMTPEMVERLKCVLTEDMGLEEKDAENFIQLQRGIYRQRICLKTNKRSTRIGPRNQWIKELSKDIANQMANFIVGILLSNRTARTKRITGKVLEHLCDITGEDTSVGTAETRVEKTLVVVADRMATWIDEAISDFEKKSKDKHRSVTSLETLAKPSLLTLTSSHTKTSAESEIIYLDEISAISEGDIKITEVPEEREAEEIKYELEEERTVESEVESEKEELEKEEPDKEESEVSVSKEPKTEEIEVDKELESDEVKEEREAEIKSIEEGEAEIKSIEEGETEIKSIEKEEAERKSIEKGHAEIKSIEEGEAETKSIEMGEDEIKSIEERKAEGKSIEMGEDEIKSIEERKAEGKSIEEEEAERKSKEEEKDDTNGGEEDDTIEEEEDAEIEDEEIVDEEHEEIEDEEGEGIEEEEVHKEEEEWKEVKGVGKKSIEYYKEDDEKSEITKSEDDKQRITVELISVDETSETLDSECDILSPVTSKEKQKMFLSDFIELLKEDIATIPKSDKKSDIQQAMKNIIDKRFEKLAKEKLEKSLDSLEKYDIDKAASIVANWVENILSSADVLPKLPYVTSETPKRGSAFEIKLGKGSQYQVYKLSSTTVANKVADLKGLDLPSKRQVPKTMSPMDVKATKEWADWALDTVDIGAEWGKWLDNTLSDVEKHLLKDRSSKSQLDRYKAWQKLKDVKGREAQKWRVEKQKIKDEGKIWNRKLQSKYSRQSEKETELFNY